MSSDQIFTFNVPSIVLGPDAIRLIGLIYSHLIYVFTRVFKSVRVHVYQRANLYVLNVQVSDELSQKRLFRSIND